MKIKIPLLIATISICGCNYTYNHSSSNKSRVRHQNYHQPKLLSTNKDTLFIYNRAAVRATHDSAALIKNKQKYSDTAVEAYTEDGVYYDYIADSVLQKKKLPVIEAINYKFLKFIQKNGESTIIKVDTLSQISTLFFFDPIKRPRVADVVDIETDYGSYFHK